MDSTEIMFSLAIAMLYPFFFNKLANKVTNYNDISNMCDSLGPRSYMFVDRSAQKSPEDEKIDACYAEKENKLRDAEYHKHLVLIAVALIGLVISGVIQSKSTKVGVGIGSIITLVIALTLYWHRYNETYKLIVLGLSLLFVLFFSVKLYKIQSPADLFTYN